MNFLEDNDYTTKDVIFNTFCYPPSYQHCPYCNIWYDGLYSSSDPNYKVHDCKYYRALEEVNEQYLNN